jgi:hypothetical protein
MVTTWRSQSDVLCTGSALWRVFSKHKSRFSGIDHETIPDKIIHLLNPKETAMKNILRLPRRRGILIGLALLLSLACVYAFDIGTWIIDPISYVYTQTTAGTCDRAAKLGYARSAFQHQLQWCDSAHINFQAVWNPNADEYLYENMGICQPTASGDRWRH